MSRVGEREVIDAMNSRPLQTCHRFCTDRQGTYGGWWSSSCVCALHESIFDRQYLESSAAREVAPRLSLSPDARAVLSEVLSGQQKASDEITELNHSITA